MIGFHLSTQAVSRYAEKAGKPRTLLGVGTGNPTFADVLEPVWGLIPSGSPHFHDLTSSSSSSEVVVLFSSLATLSFCFVFQVPIGALGGASEQLTGIWVFSEDFNNNLNLQRLLHTEQILGRDQLGRSSSLA